MRASLHARASRVRSQDSPGIGSTEAPGAASSAPPAAARSASSEGDLLPDAAAAAAAAAASSPGKFEVSDTVVLFNGSLCYEAEILQVGSADGGGGGKKPATGKKKEGAGYLIRYTRWPRRPEEWVSEAFVYAWYTPPPTPCTASLLPLPVGGGMVAQSSGR